MEDSLIVNETSKKFERTVMQGKDLLAICSPEETEVASFSKVPSTRLLHAKADGEILPGPNPREDAIELFIVNVGEHSLLGTVRID